LRAKLPCGSWGIYTFFTHMEGKIKNIVSDKFFGFIAVEGRTKDLFFHKNSIMADENLDEKEQNDQRNMIFSQMKVGDMVSFDEADSPKGPNAVNVALIPSEEK
jgi:cold shock CspA family protein